MQHLDEGTLQAWLDRPRSGLDPSEVAEIERHLASCDVCASRLSALQASDDRARSLLSVGRDAVVAAPPYQRIAERAAGSRRRRRAQKRLTAMAWAASIVVAIGVGWLTNDLYRTGAELEAPRRETTPLPEPTDNTARAAPSRSTEASADRVPTEAQGAPAQAPSARPPVEEERQRASVEAPSAAAGLRPATPVAPPSPARAAAPADAPSGIVAQKGAAASAEPSIDADVRSAAPARPVVVTGRVVDERGDAVSAAQVFVHSRDIGVLTRQDGGYSLTLPEPADSDSTSFDLTVQRIGFGEQTLALSGRGGDTVVADFRLEDRTLALDEVVVTGTPAAAQRRTLGSSAETLSASAWAQATRSSADDALGVPLRTVPGLGVLSIDVNAGGGQDGGPIARVRQQLGDGLTLTMIEGRSDTGRDSWPVTVDGAVESIRVGELLITGTASVSPESLRALLETLR